MSKPARTFARKATTVPTPESAPALSTAAASGSSPAPKSVPRQRRKARIDVDRAPDAKSQPPVKTASKAAKPAAQKANKPAKPARGKTPPSKRLSALDAAAQVLAGLSKSEATSGLTAPDLIERMAEAQLWTSPSGKTPAATLYAAMIREITKKGSASRFVRVSPGHFAAARMAVKIGGRS